MRKCVNCGAENIGDGRMYPGSTVLPEQPSGIVCIACEQTLEADKNRELFRRNQVKKEVMRMLQEDAKG